jgi:GNAT superfamily N-acetyltransferase
MTPSPSPASGPTANDAVVAGAADLDTLSHVIADAFHGLAPSQWLIPDEAARREIFPGLFQIFVEHALAGGVVHTTPDRAAAALWIPVGPGGPSPPAGYAERLAAVTGRWACRFRAFDAALDHRHPAGVAHQHLAMLAVRPDRQGQGTGTALLRAHHTHLDQAGTPTYLEASAPRNRAFYQRHGYVLRPGAPFYLPDGATPMWPMWRAPSPT